MRKEYYDTNRKKISKSRKRRYKRDPIYAEKQRQRSKNWYAKHSKKARKTQKQYYKKNRLLIRKKAKLWRKKNAEKDHMQRKEANLRMKKKVIFHYSNGTMKCNGWDGVKCPFNCKDIRALSIDHIKGNGAKHRQKLGKNFAGLRFYQWLINHKYPKGFQSLCMNCQFIKKAEQREYFKPKFKKKKGRVPAPPIQTKAVSAVDYASA